MTTAYPAGLDAFTNPNAAGGDQLITSVGGAQHDAQHANVNDAVEAIEAELGTDPSGAYATVKARLDALPFTAVPKVNSFLGPYSPVAGSNGTTSDARASGGQLPCPIVVRKQISVDQIGFTVDTLEASCNARALLYSTDSDGFPATLVVDSGSQSCTTTGNRVATISAVVLPPGLYWGFVRSNSPGGVVRFRGNYHQDEATINDTFNNLTANGSSIEADCGTFASPSSTISTWTYQFNSNTIRRVFLALRRSA